MSLAATDDYDHLYKIILVGDPSVGKTHLLARYTRNSLPKNPGPTLGVELATHTVPLAGGGTVKAQIWDTAGQERYKSITAAHFRRAAGAVIVYSVTRRQTFVNASKWLADVVQHAGRNVVMLLVGNQVDLAEGSPEDRQVSTEEAAEWAKKSGLMFLETSAVTGYNVKKMFELILQEIYDREHKVICEGDSSAQYAIPRAAIYTKAGPANQVFTLSDAIEVAEPEGSQSCCRH
ncbi:small GTPase family Rab subfamily protein [Gregarina niphandrodes]|uniref:Small GTPase family Rab subfamily protein n=1 Tax=Gregarina niphandrodes TaxID=110365 RepID=A0A023BD30_GRENI|nr:small GTPase family Rab subfamily protein [Gregarina niphandrodes]EZG87065.1 small GTPase family Rab subfamily protein [Gregarina niphandrodes]|eukprot:XP_011128707.1 small GTPase family Rab subfamily protein [Gregarina niphandrodes]